jgi:hypothetical protein
MKKEIKEQELLRISESRIAYLEKQIQELLCDLRDCHDLLNDCGFFYEDGRWIDPQDDSEDLE